MQWGRDCPPLQPYSINDFIFLFRQTSSRLPYTILQIIQENYGLVKGGLIFYMLSEFRQGISGRGKAGYYYILILGGIQFSKNAGYDTYV